MAFIQWDPVVHSHITLLTQDAEQIVKVFLSLDFAQPEPSLKLALEQVKLLHLVSCIPVICGEWHIDRGLTEDRCGRCRCWWGWFWGYVSVSDGQIRKNNGRRIQKWLYLGNHWSDWLQIWTQGRWGCTLPLDGIICAQCHGTHAEVPKMALEFWGCISALFLCQKHGKQGKIQPGVCICTPRVFPMCSPVVCMNVQFMFTVHPSPFHWNISWEAGVHRSSLPPWL